MPHRLDITTLRIVRPASGFRLDRRPARLPTSREQHVSRLSDEARQIYWCINLTDGAGLTIGTLAEMTTLHPKVCLEACLVLKRHKLIRRHRRIWHIVPEHTNGVAGTRVG